MYRKTASGFTLIELSIVLVIIGLIVGGILVGVDLITATTLRSQITQIEKFNTAVNTFHNKYGYLPGDIPDPWASRFGLAARGTGGADGSAGAGDGNGMIEGVGDVNTANSNCGPCTATGEPVLFWNDLTYADGLNLNMAEGSFHPSGGAIGAAGDPAMVSGPTLNLWLPAAKIGSGNYIYVWSNGGNNYYSLSAVTSLQYSSSYSSKDIATNIVYNIDKKIDDGLPQSGAVLAQYINNHTIIWAGTANTNATIGSATTCYDNGGIAGTQQYSTAQSSGNGPNCTLSFRFQ